jgi:copper chaperone CopZ
VSVGIEKLEGVESVRVSLEEGLAAVTLVPGNALDPERIRKVARDGGFTPKQAEVRVRGRLVAEGETSALAVSGLEREYRLVEHAAAPGRLAALAAVAPGTPVVVSGAVPESEAVSGVERVLQLREFALEEP